MMNKLFSLFSIIVLAVFTFTAVVYGQSDVNVTAVDWSPDGKQIATGNTLGDIEIWSVDTGMLVNTLDGHTQEIMVVKWSPDGSQIASGSPDGTIRIWDFLSGKATRIIQFTPPDSLFRAILDIDWSPDSRYVAGARETGSIVIWDVDTGEHHTLYSHDGIAFTVAWHPSGNLIASGGFDGRVYLWDMIAQSLNEFLLISTQDIGSVYSIVWSPDGNSIAIGGGRARVQVGVQVFDFATQKLLFQVPQTSTGIVSLGWNPVGIELAISNRETVTIVDASTGLTVDSSSGAAILDDIAWSPYGGRLAVRSAAYQPATDLGNAVQMLVPAPSLERLQAIAEACNAPAAVTALLPTSDVASQLSTFVSGIEALPENTIPSGCAADLLAVAEALQGR